MKIAIIGASYLQLPLVLKAREMGHEVLSFAWEEGAVTKEYSNKFFPISVVEKDKILNVCINEEIDGITTIATDVAVPTIAYVAEKMHIIGNSPKSAYLSTNKYAMREVFQTYGLLCPAFKKITLENGCPINRGKLSYPIIVKPCDRSGSLGVTKVFNNYELNIAIDNALSVSLCKEVVVEEFIDGKFEVSVECITWLGEHHIITVTDKETSGYPNFVELAHHQPSMLPNDIISIIKEETIKGLNALEIEYGASHAEFLITEQGAVYVVEIGARMGGDFIGAELVKLSTGYDFLRGVINLSLGIFEPPNYSIRCYSGVLFYSELTKNLLPYIESAQDYPEIVMAELTSEKLCTLSKSADRSGYLIYQSGGRFNVTD